jgi:hypothetical protein
VATSAINRQFVSIIAAEMAVGVETAVECWMSQIEHALTDMHLTTLGRLNAVSEVLDKYKRLTGKGELECRGA